MNNPSSLKGWVRERYKILLKEFPNNWFTKKDAREVLYKYNKPLQNLNELFNILSENNLLETKSQGNLYYYKLKEESLVLPSSTKDRIISILKRGADIIRNQDYRLLLILLFYKSLSDKWVKKAEEYYEETKDLEYSYHLTNIEYYTLYDENERKLYTWEETIKNKADIVKSFLESLNKIAELNENLADLKELVEKLGFRSFISNPDNEAMFLDLVETFNKLDLKNISQDALGTGYEWILSYFAPTKAKAGEVYTPREVIRLMINILGIKENSDVLDPACGSAAMLIEAYKHVSERYNDGKTLRLIGQELNDVTAILGKLNLVIHGVPNFKIFHGDSLANPRFSEADYVIANPPWNLDYNIETKLNEKLKKIYSYGLTPKQSADWLWIQLMLYFSKKKTAVILDNGALFRSGREKAIREKVIEDDLLDTVILLPEKLFYNTGAPGAILIFNKEKPEERKNKILFINASKEFEKHPEVRRLNILSNDNIKKIVDAYNKFKDIEGFSKVVSVDEIKNNDYNLNVSLYVFPEEPEEEIDVEKEWEELEKIESEIEKNKNKLQEFIKVIY